MFVAVTPINEVTGVTTGNPIWVNKDALHTAERKSATADSVDHTVLMFEDGSVLYVSETPEVILPSAVGSSLRE